MCELPRGPMAPALLPRVFLYGLLAVTTAGLAAAASVGTASDLAWIRQPVGCAPPEPIGEIFTTFACGDLGRFTFSDDSRLLETTVGACASSQSGVEMPEVYRSIPSLPPMTMGQALLPCDGPTCFLETIPTSGDWVAVIDWDDWHGRSVSWLTSSLSGAPSVLFDLGTGEPAGGTSDIHVLRQLCAVAQHVREKPHRLPAAINMSFGRVADLGGYDECSTEPSDPELGCMVVEALGRLGGKIPLFAAAGNHDTLLFPAAVSAVEAVGGMDVAWYSHSEEVMTSWQTPDESVNLMPASSICIKDHQGKPWLAPPGTSWSSAILSAWVVRADPGPEHERAGRWRPQRVGSKYFLASDLGPIEGSSAAVFDQLLGHLRGEEINEDSCATWSSATGRVVQVAAVPAGSLEAEPIVLLDRARTGPTPDPDPCLPCTGGWDDAPGGGGLSGALETALLEIDLSASPGVPADLELAGLGLVRNRGALFFDLVPDEGSAASLYDQLEAADHSALRIRGLDGAVLPGDEVSLVYLFRQTAAADDRPRETAGKGPLYWSATTIQVRAQ